MQVTGTLEDYNVNFKDNSSKIVLVVNTNEVDILEKLRGSKLNVELKKWYKKRSLDANAYLWVLIREISEKIEVQPKEIYRDAISYMNTYDVLPIRDDAVDRFIENWQKNGDGWICEKFDSKLKGYTNVRAYYGSSTFNTKEMSQLIDIIIEECRNLGIETKPKAEIDALLKEWK